MSANPYIRKPAVAGMFYPAKPDILRGQIDSLREAEKDKINAGLARHTIIGGIVPHAGYIYSGYEAVHFFEIVHLSGIEYDTIVILNPDHQGYSPDFATSPHDEWETPLGRLFIDKELAKYFAASEIAHREEHSTEVMLPFIQVILNSNAKVLPISIGAPTPETAKKLASILYKAKEETKKRLLIIASSDFSHYVTPENGVILDNLALDKIENFDSNGLYQTIKKFDISVCGYGPIMTLIEYSLLISNNTRVDMAIRGNSGKHSPSKSVVDYITLIFSTQ